MEVDRGRVSYEPNSLAPDRSARDAARASRRIRSRVAGTKVRQRSRDVHRPLQPGAAVLSLDDAARAAPHRQRVHVRAREGRDDSRSASACSATSTSSSPTLGARVADGLGMAGQADSITPARAADAISRRRPRCSILAQGAGDAAGPQGRRADRRRLRCASSSRSCARRSTEGGRDVRARGAQGRRRRSPPTARRSPADHMIAGGPSVIFDAVVVVPGAAAIAGAARDAGRASTGSAMRSRTAR